MGRAGRLCLAGWIAAVASLVGTSFAGGKRELAFDVYREGSRIGRHALRIEEEGGGTVVEVDIDLSVSVLFVPLYRYAHRNRELWRDGRLVALQTSTDDNGTVHRVEGRAGHDGFKVTTASGSRLLPAPLIPTSYWNKDFVRQSQVLNTQTGQIMAIRAIALGEETILAGGRSILARRYRIEGELELELWYDLSGGLAKLRFRTLSDGSLIDYVLRPPGPQT